MKKTLNLLIITISILFFSACSQKPETQKSPNPVTDPGGYDQSMLNLKDNMQNNIQDATNKENQHRQESLNNSNDKNMQNETSGPGDNSALVKEYPFAMIKTNLGDIKVSLAGDTAPVTVGNFLNLGKTGFYDGTKFHRVIKDFMIQGGDPNSKDDSQKSTWGMGGPGYKFNDELSGNEKYTQGTLAMANSGPNTNGSQFFIVTADPSYPLPPSYTVFGHVVSGLDVALKIQDVATGANDQPVDDVTIESITPEAK